MPTAALQERRWFHKEPREPGPATEEPRPGNRKVAGETLCEPRNPPQPEQRSKVAPVSTSADLAFNFNDSGL